MPIVEDRLRTHALAGSVPKSQTVCHCVVGPLVSEVFKLTTAQLDCLNWIVETMPRKDPWSSEKIVQVLLGLWFASVHQLAMVNSLCILFIRDRYIDCN